MIYHDDCFNVFPLIEDQSIDFVLADPPYGTTACKWDSIIPLEHMWRELKRIIKPNGSIVLFATPPFSAMLIASNLEQYKYAWYWHKSRPSGFVHAKNRPMRAIEEIHVFSAASMGHVSLLGNKRMNYNPQGLTRIDKPRKQSIHSRASDSVMAFRKSHKETIISTHTGYPHNLLKFSSVTGAKHPTQKPVPLLEYLIKTYTHIGDTVLDFCMGVGSTGIAARNLSRNFIGIEKEKLYFDFAQELIGE